jgi:hypothetical protein
MLYDMIIMLYVYCRWSFIITALAFCCFISTFVFIIVNTSCVENKKVNLFSYANMVSNLNGTLFVKTHYAHVQKTCTIASFH